MSHGANGFLRQMWREGWSERTHSTPALTPLSLAAQCAVMPRTAVRVAGRPASCRVRRPRAFFLLPAATAVR
jgi:hypothetical protein